ncbi:MAG: pilus assembly PilX N-terminal domain-containing protein [Actinobacteria bacterium]|nr:pilus assembly PilX N-terminal domain-containing protein [Actinomycetota bacterium]
MTRIALVSRLRSSGQDAGIAVLTVVMVGAILTAMGVALTQTALVNLDNAGRDRVGSTALGAAEAGVSQGISFIRQNGTGQICAGCTSPYNTGQEQTITFTNGTSAQVGIKELTAYLPPANKVGRYLITAVGLSGSGPGKRTIEQTVEVKPLSFPLGIYTQAKINLGGNVSVTQESVFSGSCVDSRDKLTFLAGASGSALDPYNGLPAAVHSTSYITNTNQNACSVADVTTLKATDTRLVHRSSTCNTTWPADQTTSSAVPSPPPTAGPAEPPRRTSTVSRTATTGRGVPASTSTS